MRHYFAFNGDADGLCALQQLRLAVPQPDAVLVTGTKRDICLLQRISALPGDQITVLDVSHHQNRDDVQRLLAAGASIRYFDHHHAGVLPQHPQFVCRIDEAPEVCTSLLVDADLGGRYRAWAMVATFGDNLPQVGHALAQQAGMDATSVAILERLGIYLNYNAYGAAVADLHFDPALLAEAMLPFADPLSFVAQSPVYARLAAAYDEDMLLARQLVPLRQMAGATLMMLPDQPWARRIIGVLANALMQDQPDCAIGILSPDDNDGFAVSVRTPRHCQAGAAEFCLGFDGGGGRQLAGGINHLPRADLDQFLQRFEACFAKT